MLKHDEARVETEGSGPVRLTQEEGVTLIEMDDGKVNALSPNMLSLLSTALDEAEALGRSVVIAGRRGVFSAGFDLHVMKRGGLEALGMVRAGFLLAARLLEFPAPLVVACTGHAMAMGSFLLLTGDLSIGAQGQFEVRANEVAIGIAVPHAARVLCSAKLPPHVLDRVLICAEPLEPQRAAEAGFLHEVVAPEALIAAALERARALGKLSPEAFVETKRRSRAPLARALRRAIVRDTFSLAWTGVRTAVGGPKALEN